MKSRDEKLKEMFDGIIDQAIEQSDNGTGKFKIEPVPPKEFFEVWLRQPMFPEQYRIINQILTNEYTEWNEKIKEIMLLWGEGGCISGKTRYKDPITKEQHTISAWSRLKKNFHVLAYDFKKAKFKTVLADKVVCKGKTKLYNIKIKRGKKYHSIRATEEHRFYTPDGWKELRHLKVGDLIAHKNPGDAHLSTLDSQERKKKLGRPGKQKGTWNRKFTKKDRRDTSRYIKRSNKWKKWLNSDERQKTIIETAKKNSIYFLLHPQKCISEGGRCKWERYNSPIAGNIKIQGALEKRFAAFLDKQGTRWERCREWFPYVYKGKRHNYQPDFKVYYSDRPTYYEVKGWIRDVDYVKLEAVRAKGYHIVLADKELIKELEHDEVCPRNDTHLVYTPIVEITYVNEDYFYDFTVPTYHNYLMSGILHHNSKDYTIVRTLVYCCYWLCCLRDPQGYFKIGKDTPIVVACMSVNEQHAKEVFFKQFTTVLKQVRNPSTGRNFFADLGVDLRDGKDIQTRKVIFPNHIEAIAADASRYGIEGKNVLIAIFDEIAEVRYDRAKERYNNAKNTAFSRFPNHYKLVMISYPRDPFDFMMTKYKEVDNLPDKEQEQIFRSKKSPWEVRSKEGAHPVLVQKRLYKTEEDYLPLFKKDPEDAQRRYKCSFPKSSSSMYIKKFDLVLEKCINFDRPSPIIWDDIGRDNKIYLTEKELNEALWQPWFKSNYSYEAYKIEQELIKTGNPKLKDKLALELERHDNVSYFMHVDLSQGIKDYAGLVLLHPYYMTPTQIGYYVDLAIQIRPEDSEINFEDIRKFIYTLDNKGFDISSVSFDGFQSVDMRQQLERRGIQSDLISVDRSRKPYDTLKSLLYQGKINMYNYLVPIRELKELTVINGKVDHPKKSSQRMKEEGIPYGGKDVSDGLAGSVYSAVLNESDVGPTCIDPSELENPDIRDIARDL